MLLNCGVGEDSWESLGLQGDPTSPFWRRSALGFLWREWCWSWNSSTLATSCEELTHWKRLWCWEGLGAGGEGDARGWDGWIASLTRWTWVWVNSGSLRWTGRPGVLRFMGSQRVGHYWATELNWTELSQWYCPTILTIALTIWIWTFFGKLMSLFFNMLSRFLIAFLQRAKSLNFMATATVLSDTGTQENKICHCFYFFPFYLPWSDGTRCQDLSFLNERCVLSQLLFHVQF